MEFSFFLQSLFVIELMWHSCSRCYYSVWFRAVFTARSSPSVTRVGFCVFRSRIGDVPGPSGLTLSLSPLCSFHSSILLYFLPDYLSLLTNYNIIHSVTVYALLLINNEFVSAFRPCISKRFFHFVFNLILLYPCPE